LPVLAAASDRQHHVAILVAGRLTDDPVYRSQVGMIGLQAEKAYSIGFDECRTRPLNNIADILVTIGNGHRTADRLGKFGVDHWSSSFAPPHAAQAAHIENAGRKAAIFRHRPEEIRIQNIQV
jgi:hypothetical protein